MKQIRATPSKVVNDPTFCRVKYLRYADDVRHLTQGEILLAEKKGSEGITFGPPYLPEGESYTIKGHRLRIGRSEK